jgi:hypothetical protein
MDMRKLTIFGLSVLVILAIALPAAAWWGGRGGWGLGRGLGWGGLGWGGLGWGGLGGCGLGWGGCGGCGLGGLGWGGWW